MAASRLIIHIESVFCPTTLGDILLDLRWGLPDDMPMDCTWIDQLSAEIHRLWFPIPNKKAATITSTAITQLSHKCQPENIMKSLSNH